MQAYVCVVNMCVCKSVFDMCVHMFLYVVWFIYLCVYLCKACVYSMSLFTVSYITLCMHVQCNACAVCMCVHVSVYIVFMYMCLYMCLCTLHVCTCFCVHWIYAHVSAYIVYVYMCLCTLYVYRLYLTSVLSLCLFKYLWI